MTGAAKCRPANQPDKTQLQKNNQSIVFVQLTNPGGCRENCDYALLFITGPEKIHLRQSELNPNGMSWSPPHPTEKSQHRLTQPSNSHSISPNFPRFVFFQE